MLLTFHVLLFYALIKLPICKDTLILHTYQIYKIGKTKSGLQIINNLRKVQSQQILKILSNVAQKMFIGVSTKVCLQNVIHLSLKNLKFVQQTKQL